MFHVDDRFPWHEKCATLEGVHLGVWLACGCWCAGHLTDGRIPRSVAWPLAAKLDPRARQTLTPEEPQVLRELVASKLFHRTKSGYAMHDYLDWNAAKSVVLKRRKQAKARWNRYTRNARKRAPNKGKLNTATNGVATRGQRVSDALPTRTNALPVLSSTSAKDLKLLSADELKANAELSKAAIAQLAAGMRIS